MTKVGELHWEGGGANADGYQARFKPLPIERTEYRDDAREIEVDGRTYKVRMNHPFASMVIMDGELARVVPTDGVTRWTGDQLRRRIREVFRQDP